MMTCGKDWASDMFSHKPVLLSEVIEGLNIKPDGIYVDGTVGGGGHSEHGAAGGAVLYQEKRPRRH